MNEPDSNNARNRAFAEQFARCQNRVYAFVVALAPRWSDADEIFQRTTVVLWEKWDQFDPARSFIAWACGIARLEALKYFSQRDTHCVTLSNEVMEQIASDYSQQEETLDARTTALEQCLQKLPDGQRSLLESCYLGRGKIADIAAALDTTSNALYLKLRRIRTALHECIDGVLHREGLL